MTKPTPAGSYTGPHAGGFPAGQFQFPDRPGHGIYASLVPMLTGFKNFIMKGNVVDLAVAVVIGTAFGAVVTALVNKVLMPFIAGLTGSPNFDSFARVNFNGNFIEFGVLLTAIVNFLLISAAIYFVVVMPMNLMIERRNRRLGIGQDVKKESAEDPQVALLTEIRDALKSRTP